MVEAHGDGPGGLKLYSNPHGTVRCYHEGCRCPECEDAKERQRQYDHARYQARSEEYKERNRQRRAALKAAGLPIDILSPERAEKNRLKARSWYYQNRHRAADAMRSYRATSRGRMVHRASSSLRRARLRGALGTCTTDQLQARIDFFGGMCSYCRQAPFEHIDHAIPVARGGTNWPSNLRPACGPCNLRKWTKTAMEFIG